MLLCRFVLFGVSFSDGGARLLSIRGGFVWFCDLLCCVYLGGANIRMQAIPPKQDGVFFCAAVCFFFPEYTFAVYCSYFRAMKLRLKEICAAKGTTQKAVANLMGVSDNTLSRAARGETSLAMLEKIAAALNVPLFELFDRGATTAAAVCPHCGGSLEISLSPSSLSAPPQDEDAGE